MRRILLVLIVLPLLYAASYLPFSALGGYRFDQSGRLRYPTGLSISDLEMWHPLWAWYQPGFVDVRGATVTRGNLPGLIYAPLIRLDRRWRHPTRILIAPRTPEPET